MNLPKKEGDDRTHKTDTNTLSMLLFEHVPHTSDSSRLFSILEDLVLA